MRGQVQTIVTTSGICVTPTTYERAVNANVLQSDYFNCNAKTIPTYVHRHIIAFPAVVAGVQALLHSIRQPLDRLVPIEEGWRSPGSRRDQCMQ
jgi:hypothetical protein